MNEGSIVEPKLIMDKIEPKTTNIISKEVANKIFGLMIRVVEDNGGTGRGAAIQGKTIAAKTGTAEVNDPDNPTQKEELGWFVAIDKNNVKPTITAMMIEDVKGRGGSHFVVPKVKNYIESY